MSRKVLVVKMGYSETLTSETGQTCSLGDVFRTTVILHLFKQDQVTWLTDEAAFPLLEGNPYVKRLLRFDLITALQLLSERFDVVVNLEKVPGLCAMVSRINAWQHFGFRFDQETGTAQAYERADEALEIATNESGKRQNGKSWEQVLFAMLGSRWNGEGYVLGYKPATRPAFDVGLNMHVGPKFPLKAWPPEHWQKLEQLLAGRTVTHQQHLTNLRGYIDWVNSCHTLVTNDSLGLHLGLALRKKIVALIGPTSSEKELPPHNGHLKVLKPAINRDCMPCYRPECVWEDPCMQYIHPERVVAAIDALDAVYPNPPRLVSELAQ